MQLPRPILYLSSTVGIKSVRKPLTTTGKEETRAGNSSQTQSHSALPLRSTARQSKQLVELIDLTAPTFIQELDYEAE